MTINHDFFLIAPEILLLLGSMVFQIKSLFFPKIEKILSYCLILFLWFLAYIIKFYNLNGYGFNGSYVANDLTNNIKVIMLILSSIVMLVYISYPFKNQEGRKFTNSSYLILIMLSLLGMCLVVSARDFLLLYMGIELQTMALFIMSAFETENSKSSEAGLKYFVLSALASGLMLFGISLIYGFSGSINYKVLSGLYLNKGNILLIAPPALIVGMVMLIIGLCFKISAAPFHMWTPDVYEGSPIVSTIFFASVPKLANIVALVNILYFTFELHQIVWKDIMSVVAFMSLVVGSLGALMQTSIKRLMAYSSITNVGYICASIASNNLDSIYSAIIYFIIYSISVIGFFSSIIASLPENASKACISDLAGMSCTQKLAALSISIFAFSMIGIPPLSGFFGKFYIFKTLIQSGYYFLAISGVIAAVVSAYYYLRIVKIMYFDPPLGNSTSLVSINLYIIIFACLVFTLGFVLFANQFFDFMKFPIELLND